jgi:cytochrome c553
VPVPWSGRCPHLLPKIILFKIFHPLSYWPTWAFVCLLGLFLRPTFAENPGANPSFPDHDFDQDNAQEIMELCAGCHGEYGQGGGGGEYPRLAGMPAKYLAKQMRAFKSGERESMVMAPYANDREMPEGDLLDISIYLAGIELPSQMPFIDPELDSYEKLLIASRVFNVPQIEGDVTAGEDLYIRQCQKCHGSTTAGRGSTPGLVGQYSDYIRIQIDQFMSGNRKNKVMDKYLNPLTPKDVEAILAYLAAADD